MCVKKMKELNEEDKLEIWSISKKYIESDFEFHSWLKDFFTNHKL